MTNVLYSQVTARILTELESGTLPWVKPWSATPGNNLPTNASTGAAYQGCNVVLLWMASQAYSSPRFVTYKQALAMGGNVRKGEHGFQIVKLVTGLDKKRTNKNGEALTYATMKYYTVFNVDQCEGLDLPAIPVGISNPDDYCATCEEFQIMTGAKFVKGGDSAFYSPAGDFIKLPAFETFSSASSYYATSFHELGHWTGAKHRLDRDFSGRFGTQSYAAEELVAELTAAFLCAEFNVDGELRHAGYIQHWIKLLKEDDKAFFTAASAAQKAANFLRSKILAEETEELAA